MRKLALLIGIILVFCSGANAWASLSSGSLSTAILFDITDYTKPVTPYENRTPVENPPGGLIASAAWNQYGMRLDWSATDNGNGTYTYHYYFGPGWYPPDNGSRSNPWVTNKQITALDIQLGAGMTMNDITDATWSVYNYKNTLLGFGTATQFTKVSNSITGTATVLAVGELLGETGNSTDGYTTHDLFHGLQWVNPMDPTAAGNFLYPDAVNIELEFISSLAPGWGNFFANSTQTGSERDYTDVVAYNPFGSNTVSVPGGAPVPLPASVFLFGSGLGGIAVFRRRKTMA